MHISDCLYRHTGFSHVQNIPQHFQYSKAQQQQMPVPANGPCHPQPMETSSPLRTRPSSLNTQLYTAENFMKVSSPRRGCYMYNPQNHLPHRVEKKNETTSFHDMDIEPIDHTTEMASSPWQDNRPYELKNQRQQIINKRKCNHENSLFVQEYPSLSKRRRLEAFVTDEHKIITF